MFWGKYFDYTHTHVHTHTHTHTRAHKRKQTNQNAHTPTHTCQQEKRTFPCHKFINIIVFIIISFSGQKNDSDNKENQSQIKK